uniref:Uncharacterized protein n=1 Tax=Candidatus Methanogaster sp. ANME-2c ERB4 TaxID=2759911 RepID=A0A7G9Y4X5_9EURY|nr:hypothetical protein MPGNBCFJ_00021 [Methanosarcinales archaeon ANME-2c ERB4]QNO42125.1 hypothetical protein CDFINFIG_00001 [Methanosarcinales archaeon ANME-2c ERB4]QNO42178.1 hypothetical protein NAKCPFIE_00003 [Methanosarcinales archaeon ANME-2c ERB4]QNO42437.1 hypothetical protein ADMFNEEM_00003 [Methanosarcinales archaeon ANME-2c ERB4]QNO42508.1 hypothetical protein AHMEGOAG_00001 [Methanosarcinales archaeon ANME-2c ERB4]
MITIKDGVKIITGKLFRLVYMEKTHIITIEGIAKSTTWTKQEVEEFTTEKQAKARISELDLEDPTETPQA